MTNTPQEQTQEEWGLPPGYSVKETALYYHLHSPEGRFANSVSRRYSFRVAKQRLQEQAKTHLQEDGVRRLIAAAPTMLEACKMALAALESPEARRVLAFTMEREALRDAIAAAEPEKTP